MIDKRDGKAAVTTGKMCFRDTVAVGRRIWTYTRICGKVKGSNNVKAEDRTSVFGAVGGFLFVEREMGIQPRINPGR